MRGALWTWNPTLTNMLFVSVSMPEKFEAKMCYKEIPQFSHFFTAEIATLIAEIIKISPSKERGNITIPWTGLDYAS
jgi:hypothetical protein